MFMKKLISFSILFVALLFSCTSTDKEGKTSENSDSQQAQLEKVLKLEQEMGNSDPFALNDSLANLMVNAYKGYVNTFPADTLNPHFLFKAADVERGLRRPLDAIQTLELLLQLYPNHKIASKILIVQAFIFETELGMKGPAYDKYNTYIERYPDHPKVAEVRMMRDAVALQDSDLMNRFKAEDKLAN